MDQIKIGKFIAKERKRKKYTQRQLAEILGISDKTISKWECGNGFPEVSLLLPVCDELDISVNELLSGERLSEEGYRKKAEANMVKFIQEKDTFIIFSWCNCYNFIFNINISGLCIYQCNEPASKNHIKYHCMCYFCSWILCDNARCKNNRVL